MGGKIVESTISAKPDVLFCKLYSLSTINYLCLDVIIKMIKNNKTKISIKDISHQVLAEFWQLDLDNLEMDSDVKLLNEVRILLMTRFGLTDKETPFNIMQILNYSDDRIINAKLFASIKSSLKKISNPLRLLDIESANYWKKILENTWKCDVGFFEQNSNEIIIDKAWSKYIISNYDDLNNFIDLQIHGGFKAINNNVNDVADKNTIYEETLKEDNFEILDKLENRMRFQIPFNKSKFSCLEEAYEYLKFTYEEYNEYKTVFLKYCNKNSFKTGANKYMNIATLLLLYTAIYRYNEDDSSGFWPEFFNDPNYSYSDVGPIMNSLKRILQKYDIRTENRQYLEKANLSIIFSNIYIPDVSIRKIYSAIYLCYFRGTGNKQLYNLFEFYDRYSYKLDKPGSFFLIKDYIIEDSFGKIINLFNNHLSDQTNISNNHELPSRFIDSFITWLSKEKVELDSSKEEYYIDSPKICFDVPNEKIVLRLPNQKSRVYSDNECGWKITIDNRAPKLFEARIIKQKEGSYLILDEEIKLNYYKHIQIEYIFNGRTERTWEFNNTDDCLIFNEKGRLENKLIRQKCIIGVYKSSIKDNSLVIEENTVTGWNDYIFYYLNLENYPNNSIVFTNGEADKSIEIEDYPSMKRSLFKLAFEKFETDMIGNGQIPIYDRIGQYNIYSPNLNICDFDVILQGLDDVCKGDHKKAIIITKKDHNNIVINFDEENMIRGIYYFTIRYKNKIFHREEFVLVDKIVMIDEFNMDYSISSKLHRKLAIRKNELFEIIPIHVNTLVTTNDDYYLLEINNDVVAKFGMSINGRIIPVKKVILPLKWSIIGLDNIISNRSKIIDKDISMNEFINSNPRFEIENFDYRYDVLTYNLTIKDNASSQTITERKKLAFGYEFKLNFSDLKDRLLEFTNLTIKLEVFNDNELLYENILINLYDKIEMLNCKISYDDGFLYINWNEKHSNKHRIFKLYNYLEPWSQPHSIPLDDDADSLVLDLKDKNNGRYIPIIDFKKETSLFDNINENYIFFSKTDLKNVIINKYGKKSPYEIILLKKILYLYSKNRLDEVEDILKSNKIDLTDAKKVFLTIIQMSYFIDKHIEDQLTSFINHTYIIINKLIKAFTNIENIFEILIESKDEFMVNDFELILNILLACTGNINYSDILIDNISDVDTINALCSIKNNSGVIPNNLKTRMEESFDYEVLSSARDYRKIMEMVANEIEIINTFWLWIMEYRNNYILKYKFTLPRAFRIFEYENEISTIKIDGNKLDDLVEDIKCEEIYHNITFPNRWSERLDVKKEIYDSFKILINQPMDSSYKHLLEYSFLSVLQNNQIKQFDYFNMIIKMYFSNRWQLFNRYRAYFKLIFI
jgi:hypothetical protein